MFIRAVRRLLITKCGLIVEPPVDGWWDLNRSAAATVVIWSSGALQGTSSALKLTEELRFLFRNPFIENGYWWRHRLQNVEHIGDSHRQLIVAEIHPLWTGIRLRIEEHETLCFWWHLQYKTRGSADERGADRHVHSDFVFLVGVHNLLA